MNIILVILKKKKERVTGIVKEVETMNNETIENDTTIKNITETPVTPHLKMKII